MKLIFHVFAYLFWLFILVVWILLYLIWSDTFNPYDTEISSDLIPKFEKYTLDSWHIFDNEKSLPMRGSTLIDLDNDWVDEIFLGGWAWQDDQIFAFRDRSFIDVSWEYSIEKWISENSLAGSSVDLDNNWFTDLIVSRDSAIYVYYNDWKMLSKDILYETVAEFTSPLWLTFWDINKDWFLDMFISGYVRREYIEGFTNFSPSYGWESILALNDGEGNFQNITHEAWLFYEDIDSLYYTHNTFQWIFVDLDNDTWLDLIVAHDTWEPRIFKNNGDLTFSLQKNPYSDKFSYPMWIATWDYDNDGDTDIFFSNIGSSLPKTMVQGNLENTDDLELGWFLLRNDGNFNFTDVADQAKIANFEFSWGWIFADMNNDWLQDLIVAENYVDFIFHKLFPLPGRFLLQKTDNTFAATGKQSWVENKHFGITPLISDFNQDWELDLVWVNIAWPSFAFLNKGVGNSYLQVQLPETSTYIWSKIILELENGKKLTQDYIIWEGLAADQSNLVHFWLWDFKTIKSLRIRLWDSSELDLWKPYINQTISLK